MRRPPTQSGCQALGRQNVSSTARQAASPTFVVHRAPAPQSSASRYAVSARQLTSRPFSQVGASAAGSHGRAVAGTHCGTGASKAQRPGSQVVSDTPASPQTRKVFPSQVGPSSGQAAPSASPRPQAVKASAEPVSMPNPMDIRLIDSHAHLDGEKFAADRNDVLERARAAGVVAILTIGVDLASSERAVALALAHEALYATVGVHPHDAARFDDADWPRLCALFAHAKVRGVGETGLDYFYDFSPRARQQALFRRQLELAGEVGRPVVIHIRDAYDDAFALIAEVGLPSGGVVHCFTGGPAECERALALGLHVSIPGIVTFKNGDALRAAVPLIPDDRLLVETDAPYLAPLPHRGRRNEPAYVVETARKVAEVRGQTLGDVATATRLNTCRLFGLPAV